MNCFVRDVSDFRRCFTWARYPMPNPSLIFHTRFSPLQDVENWQKIFYMHAKVDIKTLHDIAHSKLPANQDKMAKLLFMVPVYFQSPMRISKMFLIIFVLGTGNMYSL